MICFLCNYIYIHVNTVSYKDEELQVFKGLLIIHMHAMFNLNMYNNFYMNACIFKQQQYVTKKKIVQGYNMYKAGDRINC